MTLQAIEEEARRDREARRNRLIERLRGAAAGKPWSYVLYGSLARGDHRPLSDADILVVASEGVGDAWLDAWQAAERACVECGFSPDIRLPADLPPWLRERVLDEGIHLVG